MFVAIGLTWAFALWEDNGRKNEYSYEGADAKVQV